MSKSTWWFLGGIAVLVLLQRQQQQTGLNGMLLGGLTGTPPGGIFNQTGNPATFWGSGPY